jgi:hypothetical protein
MVRTASALWVAVLLIPFWPALAQEHGAAVDAAEKAAQSWLALVDSGQYAESWDEAASFFQSKVTKEQWQTAMQSVRAPLGRVQARKLKSATYTTDVPNAPKGKYVILQYQTSFANMKAAVETVTPMKEADGTWKVSGYYIRPAE